MHIIPNIFLQNGNAVSLYKGSENDQKKVYDRAPETYAKWFDAEGMEALFIVDLNGTEQARLPLFRKAFSGEIWWAGQVRSMETIRNLLNGGANRIVLGHSAENIFKDALAEFGEKIIPGIQAYFYDDVPALCEKYVAMGFKDILVKDMNAEGTLFNPNYDLMEKCVYFSGANIYASGGVSDEYHLTLLKKAGVKGAVIGRAFYENILSPSTIKNHFGRE
ncbi:MAG: HisA/HisF-related TIM barrel protein [Candidatus Gracilibacteria bacterium]